MRKREGRTGERQREGRREEGGKRRKGRQKKWIRTIYFSDQNDYRTS